MIILGVVVLGIAVAGEIAFLICMFFDYLDKHKTKNTRN